jgi:hypothetical protein
LCSLQRLPYEKTTHLIKIHDGGRLDNYKLKGVLSVPDLP